MEAGKGLGGGFSPGCRAIAHVSDSKSAKEPCNEGVVRMVTKETESKNLVDNGRSEMRMSDRMMMEVGAPARFVKYLGCDCGTGFHNNWAHYHYDNEAICTSLPDTAWPTMILIHETAHWVNHKLNGSKAMENGGHNEAWKDIYRAMLIEFGYEADLRRIERAGNLLTGGSKATTLGRTRTNWNGYRRLVSDLDAC